MFVGDAEFHYYQQQQQEQGEVEMTVENNDEYFKGVPVVLQQTYDNSSSSSGTTNTLLDITLSDNEQLLLNILPRVAACISLACSMSMIVTILQSQYYRRRIYHRIILGCAINICILNVLTLWGSAAVPKDMSAIDIIGAHGNETTCTIQGFLYHWALFVTPLYYDTLSILSYAALRNKSITEQYSWMEKWIHIGVALFPLGSAAYLLSIDAYNPAIWRCGIMNYPMGCTKEGQHKCERGPPDIERILLYLFGIPVLLILLIPIIVMFMLYWNARKYGSLVAGSIARQSSIYLLTLLWTYSFRLISVIFTFSKEGFHFIFNLLANTNENLIGLWILIVYWYFRSADPTQPLQQTHTNNTGTTMNRKRRQNTNWFTVFGKVTVINSSNQQTNQQDHQYQSHDNNSSLVCAPPTTSMRYKPDYSIFDGNDVPTDSPWSAFLQEGIDDDYVESNDVEINLSSISLLEEIPDVITSTNTDNTNHVEEKILFYDKVNTMMPFDRNKEGGENNLCVGDLGNIEENGSINENNTAADDTTLGSPRNSNRCIINNNHIDNDDNNDDDSIHLLEAVKVFFDNNTNTNNSFNSSMSVRRRHSSNSINHRNSGGNSISSNNNNNKRRNSGGNSSITSNRRRNSGGSTVSKRRTSGGESGENSVSRRRNSGKSVSKRRNSGNSINSSSNSSANELVQKYLSERNSNINNSFV